MSSVRSTSTPSTSQTHQPATAAQAGASYSTKPSTERIAMRAYEKWQKRGCVHGYDMQDWVEAEKELMEEQNRSTSQTRSAMASSPAQSGMRR
jgi:hypothetical protein